MLKFNIKEHKLEELEKYGFVISELWNVKCYSFNCIPYKIFVNCYNGMLVYYSCTSKQYEYSDTHYLEQVEDIAVLIKNGLVIKEQEEAKLEEVKNEKYEPNALFGCIDPSNIAQA